MATSVIEVCRTFNSFSKHREQIVLAEHRRLDDTTTVSVPDSITSPCAKSLFVAGSFVGIVPPFAVDAFTQSSLFTSTKASITLSESLSTYSERTEAIDHLLAEWKALARFECLRGWRNERYNVYGPDHEPLVAIERSAIGLFGVRAYGCHLNGYVRQAVTTEDPNTTQILMWIARRSYQKQTNPGKLDNIVGGGLPCGITPTQNIIKECFEEAHIPPDVASHAVSTGVVSFWQDSPIRGFIPDTEYCYDLELPSSFIPNPADGEVHEFYLWDLNTVLLHLQRGEFTHEAGLVIVDFLIRHGAITPESEPAFLELSLLLRREFPFAGPSFNMS
ncbi:hypothetical protein BASA50_002316 [Batrachochytrium salamandrivorans]|uniref:Nudix hydrolase domain-containing protein n=1 Tax=Batrachochytrium salamandrivorans TaxID=1357716 RepID=A0ABQ8FPG3_9FUNG|nr:hypothetical protein BASA50_002316 [Batrachochytrium salamandrivorans]KAH9257457.1 hypothetical protein BASA81_004384 [Batrachochytrium salamandrivorans]KAH9276715.1 hypothetical protein BASA83_000848 [Batrachochytrium salamandrivorans]